MNTRAGGQVCPSSDVIGQRLGDEFVLIHLRTNRMYELNLTAARIWELLTEACDRMGIESRLLDEFDADGSDIAADVGALLSHLKSEKLVTG